MPNTESAKKALRQSEHRRVRNISTKRLVKKTVKQYRQLLSRGQFDDAKAKLPLVYKSLDKAVKKGVIKKNKSNRLKSRLTNQLNKASASSTQGQLE